MGHMNHVEEARAELGLPSLDVWPKSQIML
jgi:hypothetical protein